MTNPKTIAEPQGECELVTREFAAPVNSCSGRGPKREHLELRGAHWPLDTTVDLRGRRLAPPDARAERREA
jgi:hypothetical protein